MASGLHIEVGPDYLQHLFTPKLAPVATYEATEQGTHTLLLPCCLRDGLPFSLVTPFQAKLSKCIDT